VCWHDCVGVVDSVSVGAVDSVSVSVGRLWEGGQVVGWSEIRVLEL